MAQGKGTGLLIIGALVEAVMIGIGVVAYSLTQSIIPLIIAIVLGSSLTVGIVVFGKQRGQ